MTGDELVLRVLDSADGGVEPLIELAGHQETEWLEFKAKLAEPPDPAKNVNLFDYYWHISRGLISMVNGRGGAVLLGVGDHCESVGIEASDLDGDGLAMI